MELREARPSLEFAPPPAKVTLPDPLPRKLNVGCGFDYRRGYLNVDMQAMHKPDVVSDVSDLPMLPSCAFDEILAQDILEHLERSRTAPALAEWARLLAPEGILHVRVPSLLGMFELLASPDRREPEKAEEIIHLIYGTQAYTGDYHLAGFTAETLNLQLERAGLLICKAQIKDGWLFDVYARKTRALADVGEFIHAAYFAILGRPVDPRGLVDYGDAITNGTMSRNNFLTALRQSAEATFLAQHPVYMRPFMQLFQQK